MMENTDFERAWLSKLSDCVESLTGTEIRDKVMRGSDALSDASDRKEVIDWSAKTIERLETLFGPDLAKSIMTSCSCEYPKENLREVRAAYEAHGDLDQVHSMLQRQFESFLRETLELGDDLTQKIIDLGWGLAGVRQGKLIIATKIPKSENLKAYFLEADASKRRQLYCHCPRIKEALATGKTISPTYCYCGAGFYKGIWEEILQMPVRVELLESVLQGADVCRVAIHLP